jgi:hypothetical protein
MNSTSLGQWLQVGANIGILAGLVLVFAQLEQSNDITAAELFSDILESTVVRDLALLGETPEVSMTRVLLDPDSATNEDYFVADMVYMATLRQFNRALVLSRAGLYGTDSGINARGFVLINYHLFASAYGLAWLDQRLGLVPGGDPRLGDLQYLRDLAAERLAVDTTADRQARAAEIRKQLATLRAQPENP